MSTSTDLRPDRRFFSLEEANRMLPLVRRIVDDILEEYAELQGSITRLNAVDSGEENAARRRELKEGVDERAARVDALVTELHDLGCYFKGFQDGLVDWFSLYADRPVFLCWKRGEPEIEWWHQVDAGFIGRQPILPHQRHAFRAASVGDPRSAGPGGRR